MVIAVVVVVKTAVVKTAVVMVVVPQAVATVVTAKCEPKLGIAALARTSRLVRLPECHEKVLV